MKQMKDLKTQVLAIMMLSMGTASFAQNAQHSGNRPSREQMIEIKANEIAKKLNLDEKNSQKFLEIFKGEQEEMRSLKPQRGESKGTEKMSEEDQKKMDSIKEKYTKKYREILSQEQITNMYNQQREQAKRSRRFGGNR